MKGIKIAITFLFGAVVASGWWMFATFSKNSFVFGFGGVLAVLGSLAAIALAVCWILEHWEDT